MALDPQKVSAVLADPTRYAIFQYVQTVGEPRGVGDVARRFGLHPNVARMHLTKLVDIELLAAQQVKTGRGGRPGYVYTPTGKSVALSVPARQYALLADMLVRAVAALGPAGLEAARSAGRDFGERLGREVLGTRKPKDQYGALAAGAEALNELGVDARVTGSEQLPGLVLKNCGFREVAVAHPEVVCQLCKAVAEGVVAVCLGQSASVEHEDWLPKGDRECSYSVDGFIRLQ